MRTVLIVQGRKYQGDQAIRCREDTAPIPRRMGAGQSSLQTSIPNQLQLGEAIASLGRYSLGMQQHQCSTPCHETPLNTNHNIKAPSIPGGAYMIPPLATVSVSAALLMKLITWRELRTWIALWEIRTWRDTKDPEQRNTFTFSPPRVAQGLGRKRAGSQLKRSLAELQHLGLAHLSPTRISFTESLDTLPPDLRAETERILRVFGNINSSRAIRMHSLMRHIMKLPRPQPVRAVVIFALLLRIMMVQRNGWYKGCLTTALLVDLSGFHQSRIKHERAALVREGFFERLETPARVRRKQGNWYVLGHDLPFPHKPSKCPRTAT